MNTRQRWHHYRVLERCRQGVARGMVNARAVSRGQNALVGKFKMAAGDIVSIRGQVMEYTPTGIKREMVEGVSLQDCCWRTGGHSF